MQLGNLMHVGVAHDIGHSIGLIQSEDRKSHQELFHKFNCRP